MKVKKSEVKPIIEATFPEYKGRTFRVEFSTKITFWDTNWGGGSRNVYRFARFTDGAVGDFGAIPAPWDNPVEGKTIEIPEDVAVVCHSMFCGKDCGITITAHTSRNRMLP